VPNYVLLKGFAMGKNTIKKPEEVKVKKNSNFKLRSLLPKETAAGNLMDILLNGTFLTRNGFLKLVPLILFISLLGIIYIANNYWAIKNYREINLLKKELKELRFEHITTKSDFMYKSKQSEVARKLDSLGIKESTIPPQKFIIKSNN
jgi:hypothetical protein